MRTPNNDRLTSTETSPAAKQGKREPERRCVLTRSNGARADLIRLALAPDGRVLPDVQARAPGRGAWIGVNRPQLEKALEDGSLKRALARAFGTGALDIPHDLAHLIEAALVRQLLDRLGLELRAGHLLAGSQRIDKAAREGQVVMLFHAADASPDGAAKLDQAWRVGMDAEGTGRKGASLPLDRDALSVALGRDNVVHLAAIDAGAGQRIAAMAARLAHYRGNGSSARDEPAGDGGQDQDGWNDEAGVMPSAEHDFAKDRRVL